MKQVDLPESNHGIGNGPPDDPVLRRPAQPRLDHAPAPLEVAPGCRPKGPPAAPPPRPRCGLPSPWSGTQCPCRGRRRGPPHYRLLLLLRRRVGGVGVGVQHVDVGVVVQVEHVRVDVLQQGLVGGGGERGAPGQGDVGQGGALSYAAVSPSGEKCSIDRTDG
ncbi:hypothetical protein L209DRAFT_269281 [Thermothelomyces heterothallicus CBS 203.75]